MTSAAVKLPKLYQMKVLVADLEHFLWSVLSHSHENNINLLEAKDGQMCIC